MYIESHVATPHFERKERGLVTSFTAVCSLSSQPISHPPEKVREGLADVIS